MNGRIVRLSIVQSVMVGDAASMSIGVSIIVEPDSVPSLPGPNSSDRLRNTTSAALSVPYTVSFSVVKLVGSSTSSTPSSSVRVTPGDTSESSTNMYRDVSCRAGVVTGSVALLSTVPLVPIPARVDGVKSLLFNASVHPWPRSARKTGYATPDTVSVTCIEQLSSWTSAEWMTIGLSTNVHPSIAAELSGANTTGT